MSQMTPQAERQFQISINAGTTSNAAVNGPSISQLMAQKTGGDISSDPTKVWNGGSLIPAVIGGPSTISDIVCTCPFDRVRDTALLAQLRQGVGILRFNVSVVATNEQLIADTEPVKYANVLLTAFTELTADASSGNQVNWAVGFSVTTVG